ncbi:MAG: tetratricopeptide repeat protein [Almyronema sp.]
MNVFRQASELVKITVACLLAIALLATPVNAETMGMAHPEMRIPSFDYPYYIAPERIAAETYLNQGLSKAYQQDRDGAIADLSRAIATDPTYEMAYRYLGDLYREINQLELALAAYSHALVYNPFFARLYNSRGEVLLALDRSQAAIADFSKAIEVYPEDPIAYYNRGRAYADLKNYPQAIFDLRQAIQISDLYADAYVSRGQVRQSIDNVRGAIADYLTAAELLKSEAESQTEQGNNVRSQQLWQQYHTLVAKVDALTANLS